MLWLLVSPATHRTKEIWIKFQIQFVYIFYCLHISDHKEILNIPNWNGKNTFAMGRFGSVFFKLKQREISSNSELDRIILGGTGASWIWRSFIIIMMINKETDFEFLPFRQLSLETNIFYERCTRFYCTLVCLNCVISSLTRLSLVPHICVSESCQHWYG